MQISAKNLGKKFSNEWIFRNLNYEFQSGESYTFVGANGSGKSTLLQVLSGFTPHSEGEIHYQIGEKNLEIDNYYKHLVIAAPYLELIEDFTLSEIIDFHVQFKPFKNHLSPTDFTDFIELPQAKNKAVKFFSSGMKQRVKLGLAFWSDSEILMLDEPTSNLDIKATEWYLKNVQEYSKNRLLMICSNQPSEYEFCNNILNIQDYK
ncbi:ATP-binding cassette domain-containing protein [Arcicella sp. LKC2W]|uniref:ABC transporter ATP-binding protein n=1 Tax=Arcicella sp. LKC2W TaxID=2984198 RepID=UPI002B220746|nr:ATP-binding cassette domain-containing protein [Arcicella sp. LKC2W]MEA5460592.1 ATP-binding cassette domain-containing protein [Arcicella sp. LKC2W]